MLSGEATHLHVSSHAETQYLGPLVLTLLTPKACAQSQGQKNDPGKIESWRKNRSTQATSSSAGGEV